MGEIRRLGREGDIKQIWNKDNEDEVAAAKDLFDKMTKKGYLAFKVDKDGEKSVKMKTFDPNAEKIILVPPVVGG